MNSGSEKDVDRIVLKYTDSVRTRFFTLIILLSMFIAALPFIRLFSPGWTQLFLMVDLLLILFYRYRLIRTIIVTDDGISEILGKREWHWEWNEIAEIRETTATNPGAAPSRRMVVEHESTHDMAFDDDMPGYDAAVTVIRRQWEKPSTRRIASHRVPMFLLKYW
ncbi:MAG TPA: hypothetical protein PLV45_06770 [bacterium]|nr:hypothetical protein [bacterium]